MTTHKKTRTVFDTNQIVAAGAKFLTSSPESRDCPTVARVSRMLNRHRRLYSRPIARDYCAKLQEQYKATPKLVMFIGSLLKMGEEVKIVSKDCSPCPRNADAVKFILCALDGKADLLVTDEKDILDIRHGYPRPTICTPEEAEQHFD